MTAVGQVVGELRSAIVDGTRAPGERLPSEPDLARALGISRPTLRDALRALEDEGLVRRVHGSGTYVTGRPLLRNNLERNAGVTDVIASFGQRPGTRERTVAEEPAPAWVTDALGVEQALVVRRIRTADDRPVVYSVDYVRPGTAVDGESLYASFGAAIHHGVATLRPVTADAFLAGALGVAVGAPLLELRQVDYDESDGALAAAQEYHVADAFDFTVYRRGPA
jgi:DNA-binding GntR family transcriptional regulator